MCNTKTLLGSLLQQYLASKISSLKRSLTKLIQTKQNHSIFHRLFLRLTSTKKSLRPFIWNAVKWLRHSLSFQQDQTSIGQCSWLPSGFPSLEIVASVIWRVTYPCQSQLFLCLTPTPPSFMAKIFPASNAINCLQDSLAHFRLLRPLSFSNF